MSRSYLAVLISLIGSGFSWHEAGLAQVSGDAAATQAMPARDAAIRSALGLGPSRDDAAAARQPSTSRPGKAEAGRRRSLAPTPPPVASDPRWDATALGLEPTPQRDDARGAGAASTEDGRIRSILGFGAPPPGVAPLVTARPAWVPRAVARRDERVEGPTIAPDPPAVASPVAAATAPAPQPTLPEPRPSDPDPGPVAAQATPPDAIGSMFDGGDDMVALDRAAPSAYLSPLAEIAAGAPFESIALPLRADNPQPRPQRRSRNDPQPMIADAPSAASRRGGTGTDASLALTSDDLERAADRLRSPTRDRRDAGGSSDPLAALIQVQPRAGDEAYDSPRRLIAAIVERTRDARIAADVFRRIASDIESLGDRRIVAEAAPDARRFAGDPVGAHADAALVPAPATGLPTAFADPVDVPTPATPSPVPAAPACARVAGGPGVATSLSAAATDPSLSAGRIDSRAVAITGSAWALLPLEAAIPEPIAAKAAFVDGLVAMQPATRPVATPVDTSLDRTAASQSEAAILARASPFEQIVAALAASAPPQPAPLRVRVLGPAIADAAPMPFVPRAAWSDAFGDAERRAASAGLAANAAAIADAAAARAVETKSRRPSVWVDVFDPALDLPRRPTRQSAPEDGTRRVVAAAGLRIDPLAHRGGADHDFGAPLLVASRRFEPSGSPFAATGRSVADLGEWNAQQSRAVGLDRAVLGLASSVASGIRAPEDRPIPGNRRIDATVDRTNLVGWTDPQTRIQEARVDSVRL